MGAIIAYCVGNQSHDFTNEIEFMNKRYNYINNRLNNIENLILLNNANIKKDSLSNLANDLHEIKTKINNLDQKIYLYNTDNNNKFNSIDQKLQGIKKNTIFLVHKSEPQNIPQPNHLLTM